MTNNKLYRYEIGIFTDKFNVKINLRAFEIIKITSRGYWIRLHNGFSLDGNKKWVNNYTKARFAYPTKEEAKVHFIKRNERWLKILRNKIEIIEIALSDIKHIKE